MPLLWPLPLAEPGEVGLDPEVLARADATVQADIDADLVAGAITLVARRGRLVHCSCLGMTDREAGRAMHADALFRIYSMTKIITSVAVLMLVEEGRLLLDQPVAQHLGDFAKLVVRTADGGTEALRRPVTVHDLLTHCSGIDYEVWSRTKGQGDLASFVTELCRHPLRCQPGTRWIYGASTDVLGRLIEVVSGQRLDRFLHERIFAPLGMVDTVFQIRPDQVPRLAQCYEHAGAPPTERMVGLGWGPLGGGLRVSQDPGDHDRCEAPKRLSGGGGLVSSTSDYLRFALMLLGDGTFAGTRILGRKTVELMRQDHLPPGHGPIEGFNFGFGLGVSVTRRLGELHELSSVGEFGWGGAACTQVFIDPAEDMITMIMPQLRAKAKTGLMLRFKQAVYAALR